MKEIDDVLLKTIGMDVQQLYSKYGHKKDWKDFLADVFLGALTSVSSN